jgi:hypothetical protein
VKEEADQVSAEIIDLASERAKRAARPEASKDQADPLAEQPDELRKEHQFLRQSEIIVGRSNTDEALRQR